MVIETHGIIESDEQIYNVMKHFGQLELIDKLAINKSSYNDFTDEVFEYKEYIYTYSYKPYQGMEQLANDYIEMLWNYDILN